jgi:hypothetical protein
VAEGCGAARGDGGPFSRQKRVGRRIITRLATFGKAKVKRQAALAEGKSKKANGKSEAETTLIKK